MVTVPHTSAFAASGIARTIRRTADATPRDATGRPVTTGRRYYVTSGIHKDRVIVATEVHARDLRIDEPSVDVVIGFVVESTAGMPRVTARIVAASPVFLIPSRFAPKN
jgi:hypothetical protein